VAFRADNGERLWSAPTRTGVVAGPISYELDGKQYIAQVVGSGQRGGYYAPNYSRLLVFKLGGKVELPPVVPYVAPELNPPPLTASTETVEKGQQLYAQNCGTCHEQGRSLFPDPRASAMLHTAEAFNTVVIDGALQINAMPAFKDILSTDETDAIRAYLIQGAHDLLEQQRARAAEGEAPRG